MRAGEQAGASQHSSSRARADVEVLLEQVERQQAEAQRSARSRESAEGRLQVLQSEVESARKEYAAVQASLGGEASADRSRQRARLMQEEQARVALLLDNAHKSLALVMEERDELQAKLQARASAALLAATS